MYYTITFCTYRLYFSLMMIQIDEKIQILSFVSYWFMVVWLVIPFKKFYPSFSLALFLVEVNNQDN